MNERMLEKLKKVEIYVSRVKENTPNSFDEFEELEIVKDKIYKNLEKAVQNLLDVCALIVKQKNLGIPSGE